MKLLIKPTDDYVKTLYKNHEHYNEGDSGLDLFCPEDIVIEPGTTRKIDLQIQCEALSDLDGDKNVSYYLYPRSSIIKTPLRLSNSVGIIDAGYRGNIIACVDNIKNIAFKIEKGTRLFQICGPTLEPIVFRLVEELSNTQRGSGGFGSTGQ
jgi:dUTP pyrophosphatase